MITEIEVEGVGIMRHLNDWQILRIKHMANRQNRAIAIIAFGLGMTVQQFKKLSPAQQEVARAAEARLNSPEVMAPPAAPARPRVPRRGEHVPIEKQIALGRELISIKAKLPRGHFMPWVEDKSGISYGQAQRFMRAAKEAGMCGHANQMDEAA